MYQPIRNFYIPPLAIPPGIRLFEFSAGQIAISWAWTELEDVEPCVKTSFTYFLSEGWTFTQRRAILLQMESSLATRYRFLLTRDNTHRLVLSQKSKMANNTSSGNVFRFIARSLSFWFKGIGKYQRWKITKQSLF